jgi:D-alanyl-lipoteichoic acid acyltransferase DltB (MBOAT superfamily)
MTTVFRIVRLFALAIWVGGLVFFGFVAAIAFKTLPDAHEAGLVVRGALISLHHIGMVAGLVYLLFTLALLATQRDTHPIRAAELVLVVAMLVLTGYSEFSVIPRMETDQIAVGGDITKTSLDSPARKNFEQLHKISVRVEAAVLFEGLLLLGMASIHGRDDFDRFA